MSRARNLQQDPPTKDAPPESVDRFDMALAGWFAQHPGAWYGTATELITALKNGADAGTDLWPQHGRAFFSQLESHRRTLRSLGVDVCPHAGLPRMISLRSCQGEKPGKKPAASTLAVDCTSDPLGNSHLVAGQQNSVSAVSGVGPAESFADARKHAHADNSARRIFENTAEALFCVIKMQDQIAEQATDLKSTVDLVANRTQELIGCGGIAVGLLQQNALVYTVRLGIAATMTALPSRTNHFDSCVRQGTVLSLPDAQQDPVLGMICCREGVKSVIVLPIFHNHEVAGTMELLFKETRCFSTGDVMTLELIADIVGGRVARPAQGEPMQSTGQTSHTFPRITEYFEPQDDPVYPAQTRLSFSQYSNSDSAPEASGNLRSDIPDPMAVLAAAPVPRKRVWTKLP
jgi:putative methionine-R-sulfoxide reductase with GAF domain